MSLTIDYFTMPPKSQEVSQIQAAEQTKLNNENQEIALQFQEHIKQNSHTTVRRKEVENDELKNDDKKNGNRKKKTANKTNKNSKAKLKKSSSNSNTGGFDIKI